MTECVIHGQQSALSYIEQNKPAGDWTARQWTCSTGRRAASVV
jgi:hypothetical protein